ncbi:MAG: VOC family protein, partial [Xanthobacteraceae bacterium]
MIRVGKIAHASYETPDLEQQAEYYTEILGLTIAAKEKDAVFLASTVDHHSVVLRKGAQAQCVRVGFQIPQEADLGDFEKQVAGHGVKVERRKDPEPSISEVLVFADPKGTVIEVFKRDAFAQQKFQQKGIVPHKLGHVAFHVT